jgi:adenylate kinase
MRLILLGPPGAGKGTQAAIICSHYKIPQISTGDMLRAEIKAGTDDGKRLNELMQAGSLVPDDVIIKLVSERLKKPDCEAGYLLDGFPRTIPQAQALKDANVKLDFVLEIQVPDSDIVRRMSGRRVHLASGRTYHMQFNPPKVVNKDDITGEPLIQRDDDKEETVVRRLQIYQEQTRPLVDYYSEWAQNDNSAPRYETIVGTGEVEEVTARAVAALGQT